MFSAAVLPCLNATSQCSTRRWRPWTTLSYSQMSPAAKTPGTELSSRDEHFTPPASPSSSPAPRASITSGMTPAPITTRSQSSDRPPAVTTLPTRRRCPRSARARRRRAPPPRARSSTPWKKPPTSAPNCALEGDVLLHDDRALAPLRRERRGHLAADVAAADQHHALGVRGLLADGIRVGERAQVVDAVEVAAVRPQAAHVRAGGEQRLSRSAPPPCSTAWPRARRRPASSRWCA